jgi:hypothetical protein
MEGQASVSDMIGFSWKKSLELLMPFRFKRWLKILIIVLFAGAGIHGCNLNLNLPRKTASAPTSTNVTVSRRSTALSSETSDKLSKTLPAGTQLSAGVHKVSGEGKTFAPQSQSPGLAGAGTKVLPGWGRLSGLAPWLVALLIVSSIALAVFFMWFAARFNFILLDVLITGQDAIKEPFGRHREPGTSYFKWSLAILGISVGSVLLAALFIATAMAILKWNAVIGVLFMILAVFLVLAVLLALGVIGAVVRDFILPIMYSEKIPVMAGIDRFMESPALSFGKVVKYLLITLGLGILAAIVQGIVGILAAICGLIAGAIVAIPGFFLVKALPLLKFPLILLGGFTAAALILAVIVVVSMVMLPVAIFFRMFALTYLTRLYPKCDLLGFNK